MGSVKDKKHKKKSHDEKKSEKKLKKAKKKEKKKEKRKQKKDLKRKLKEKLKLEKKLKKQKETMVIEQPAPAPAPAQANAEECGPSLDLMYQAKRPETKEEWESRQSRLRRVLDPSTGRMRLIKGDGEVIEEIVSKERHDKINKESTFADGYTFQLNTLGIKKT